MDQEDNYSQLYKQDNIGNYSESQDQLLNFNYLSKEFYQLDHQNSQSQLEEENSQFLEQQQINDIPIMICLGYSKINDIQIPSPLDQGKQQDESFVVNFQSQPHQLLSQCSPQFPINDFHTNVQNLNLNQYNVIFQNDNFPQQNQQVQTSTELLKKKKKQLKPQKNQSQHQEPQVFQNEQEQNKKNMVNEKKNLPKFFKKCCKIIKKALKNEQDQELEKMLNNVLEDKSKNTWKQLGEILEVEKFKKPLIEYFASFEFIQDLLNSYRLLDVTLVIKYVNTFLNMSNKNKKSNFKDNS